MYYGQFKNTDTNFFYKKMVRIMKKLKCLMVDNDVKSASEISSFVLESLLWNIPNYKYTSDDSYLEKFQGIINFIIYISFNELDSYKEANGIKELCKDEDSKQKLIDFVKDLEKFYEYV